jgi:hypothetical protein
MSALPLTILILLLAGAPHATSTPAAATTSPSAPLVQLDAGRVRYAVPVGWTEVRRADNGTSARYESDDGVGTVTVTVTPQAEVVGPDAAERMFVIIRKRIREAAENGNNELLLGPRMEPDERFLLSVHDRQRTREGRVVDRVQMYRRVGTSMIHVAANAPTEDEAAARAVHDAARALLDSARPGPGPRPRAYAKTGVKIIPPTEWTEERHDDPNGLVATFRPPDGADDGRRLVVRSRVLPKLARADVARRDALVQTMVTAELTTPPLPGARMTGAPEPAEDARFLRSTRATLTSASGVACRVTTRYRVVGEVVLAVSSVVPAAHPDPESADHEADAVALGIETLDR